MSDFRQAVFSFPIEVFRVLAPPLRQWSIQHAPLPCWRLWWDTNSGGSVTCKGQPMVLGPDRFVLVAPETRFEVALGQPIRRHLFTHFHLGAEARRMTDRVFEIPASTEAGGLARSLVRRLSPGPDIAIAEPLRGISLVGAVLAEVDFGQWPRPPTDVRVRRVVSAMDSQPGLAWPDETLARLAGTVVDQSAVVPDADTLVASEGEQGFGGLGHLELDPGVADDKVGIGQLAPEIGEAMNAPSLLATAALLAAGVAPSRSRAGKRRLSREGVLGLVWVGRSARIMVKFASFIVVAVE